MIQQNIGTDLRHLFIIIERTLAIIFVLNSLNMQDVFMYHGSHNPLAWVID